MKRKYGYVSKVMGSLIIVCSVPVLAIGSVTTILTARTEKRIDLVACCKNICTQAGYKTSDVDEDSLQKTALKKDRSIQFKNRKCTCSSAANEADAKSIPSSIVCTGPIIPD